jgi:hypothetical protein
MNKRLKELVVESNNGQIIDGKLYPHIDSRTEQDWARFAKLIVDECLELIATSAIDESNWSRELRIAHMKVYCFGQGYVK